MSTIEEISRKILFVDDEALLLEGIKRQLRKEFDITTADSGESALAILHNAGPFAIVVSDYNMPTMDGITLLNTVHRNYPQVVLIMLTGRAELDLAVNALHNAHISRFLNKPCPKEVLIETLSDGLEQYRLKRSEQLLMLKLEHANLQLNQLNSHLESLVAQKTRALKLQYDFVANMTHMTDTQAIINALVEVIKELTGIDQINVWLNLQFNGTFSCQYPSASQLHSFTFDAFTHSQLTKLFETSSESECIDLADIPLNEFEQRLFSGPPLMTILLKSRQGLLGLVNLASSDQPKFATETLAALTGMIDATVTKLHSQWHQEAFEEAQDAIITALAKLSEYRDPETGTHLLRLKKYCALICQFLGTTDQYAEIVTPEFTLDLMRSSPLHDIGKVGIPDVILKKPGRLTPEEFEIMKTHASIGGDTLRTLYEQYPSQSFIKCGMEIAYCHHEKWNGTGYPQGLKGTAIPLSARILALVDVYDALTSVRVYKSKFTHEQARDIILEGMGTHFDPDLVAAFLELGAEFDQIAQQFADTL